MTVLVNGASGLVGRAVVRALSTRDEVRATVRRPEDASAVRALGAKVAVGRADEVDALAEICRGVYSLVHLIGGVNQVGDDEVMRANHGSAMVAIEAARDAGVRRLVLVSSPGADPDAGHPYLRAKGLAEEAVAASGLEHAIVRSTHAYGAGGLWFTAQLDAALADPPFVVGDPATALAPVFVDDLAAAVAAADDRQADPAGTFALEGPDVVSAAELVELLRGEDRPPEALAPEEAARRLTGLLGIPVTRRAAELWALPSRAQAPGAPEADASEVVDAAAAFGIARTPLVAGIRLVAERVGGGLG